ncbi:macrophage mannose receptor 1-like [Lepisosteus oculatus]|uniref:macrophage mannose receptor 1-like n=1 Tax=Lepisosteus oculatus TaxID=7918 RepID=UPI00371948C3
MFLFLQTGSCQSSTEHRDTAALPTSAEQRNHIHCRKESAVMEKSSLPVLLLTGLCGAVFSLTRQHFYVGIQTSWPEAQRFCRTNFKDLSTVNSQAELEQLMSMAEPGSLEPWIGLYRDTQEWRWAAGQEVTFCNWRRRLFCATAGPDGLWVDGVCDDTFPFMCYTNTSDISQRYTLVLQPMSWSAAREYCRQNHTDLVSVQDRSENAAVSARAQGRVFWIGLFNEPWKWADGANATYRNWYYRQPDDWAYAERCVVMSWNGFWFDFNCSLALTFYCCSADPSLRCQLNSDWKTWDEARSFCRSQNADLAVVRSQEENEQLQQPPYLAWIGLLHDQENWQWVSGADLGYSNWKTQLFCAAANPEGYWWDFVCDLELPFMCYTDTSDVSQRYTLVLQPMSWSAAREHCRQNHTDLVSVQDRSENAAVSARAQGSVFWIGLFNEPWKWADGANATYRNWRRYSPDNNDGKQKCTVLNLAGADNGTWNDKTCSEQRPFFCQDDVRDLILVRENRSWEEALDFCRSHYSDLTSIVSAKEQVAALRAAGTQSEYVWLGLRQSLVSGAWFWVNREPLGYEAWGQGGQPQCPLSSHCGAMSARTQLWTDLPCDLRLSFICYRD